MAKENYGPAVQGRYHILAVADPAGECLLRTIREIPSTLLAPGWQPLRLLALLLVLLAGGAVTEAGAAPPVATNLSHGNPIGLHTSYFTEAGRALSLDEASAAYGRGEFSPGRNQVLTFGIGPNPVWIHFKVSNPEAHPVQRQLSVETPWLDDIDVYFRSSGKTVAKYHVGDREAFDRRPVDNRYFVFDHRFSPGVSDVFLRVETRDPMVVPIYLMSLEHAHTRERAQDYSYGFLYGFLFALLAYNVMLYAGLRRPRYILYSLYLGTFLLMNVSYTGHGFQWLWPDSPHWGQWSNPILMMLYGASGLIFALRFLEIRTHFPRVQKAILGYLGVSGVLLLLTILFDQQRAALLLAFTFVFLFTGMMLAMGILSARSGQKPAQYFLLAAIAAMIGAATTALAVWGFIPFNTWTFRAVDIGMLLDATLLALALTYQFRVGQEQKLRAEELATLDPLTGINNRRAFYDKTTPIWNIAQRHDHSLSVILLDIDRFKRINDEFGHAYGDEVLRETANVLTDTIREQDVAARWGGEEFLLLLPETDLREAAALADRLCSTIEGLRFNHAGSEIRITASLGVAQRKPHHQNLDAVISRADQLLYTSKEQGRNRVTYDQPRSEAMDVSVAH